ncbi:unnamed protein product [Symbiodinium pilosum]|uniref:Uncharacterized protein n=1 Tax=Symbiodinium pilosum TaxID=2952 RepID=A0A812SJ79_SYMPI|nr:unnamed protein product [Symbiodinium pilosum]
MLLESIPILRKRFRKGRDWIREPGETSGDNVLQTTKAIELNFSTLRTVFKWMPSQKLSITTLEPEVKALFRKMNHVPEDRRQSWIDSWSVRTMQKRKEWAKKVKDARLAAMMEEGEEEIEDEDEDQEGPAEDEDGEDDGYDDDDNAPGPGEDEDDDARAGNDEPEEGGSRGDEHPNEEDGAGDEGENHDEGQEHGTGAGEEGEEEEDNDADDAIVEEGVTSSTYGMAQKRDRLKNLREQIAALQASMYLT